MSEFITNEKVLQYYQLPFMDLLWRAQQVHRENFVAGEIQRSTLLSIKTGGCSEDCGYCSQSARHGSDVKREKLLSLPEVIKAANVAKDKGASRFCMGAAWRGPKDKDLTAVIEMVEAVKSLGLETCVTLGELKAEQADKLKAAGLDYYNHNLDTAEEYYQQVVQTHSYADRLNTLSNVRQAGIKVCCGGIIGMGETRENRAALISQLANLPTPPESVPINNLVPIAGTPFADKEGVDDFEFVRTIAVARIAMPKSWVRLSAGRDNMSPALQTLCFLAGANSIFYGEKLLTADNADIAADQKLFNQLNLVAV